ncbi:MAG: BlaI/MecI/CopY family transcriptional regulator [Rhodanobacter sp.]
MRNSTIGDQELALLQHVDASGTVSVGEVAVSFGEPRGLARSTVLTMMERLRGKGYLRRRRIKGAQSKGVFRYSIATGPGEAMRSAVGSFVEKTLSGSVSPFVAWMSEHAEVSDSELDELQALVTQLQSRRKEP